MISRTYLLSAVLLVCGFADRAAAQSGQTRPTASDAELRGWLENMAWHHRFSADEMCDVLGLTPAELQTQRERLGVTDAARPARDARGMFVLPYPGGRHPRIGFLDGAVEPQRETKLSVFCPWDDESYVVADVPEALWSNLGLTYLAHTHVPTLWSAHGITLPRQEWEQRDDGGFRSRRLLPNGIAFGVDVSPVRESDPRHNHLRMSMWLTNGTAETMSDLRVQNCVMLKGARGFTQTDGSHKLFEGDYACAEAEAGGRWVITAWSPLHRCWGNAPCPCLHSDPKFPDCAPGETVWLRGWLSFYEGTDILAELARIDATDWRNAPVEQVTGNLVGEIIDADSGERLPARIYIENLDDGSWHFAQPVSPAGEAVVYDRRVGQTASIERHTCVSADLFQATVPPGRYRVRAEHGKEYAPIETTIDVVAERMQMRLELRRFVDMPALGWYSGDTHVHRPLSDLPTAMPAEDLHVALPLTYWVRDNREIPAASGPVADPIPWQVAENRVYYPINTEYEIFTIEGRSHTQGAVFVLNHREPLRLSAPQVLPVAEEARRQGAILDLDKHSWNWSLMIVPLMNVDLFELSNNHHWRTEFGFPRWTLENAPPDWPEIEKNDLGFTERGWTEFGMQTYYELLNCGFRMRVTGGTASGVHPVPLGYGRVYVHCGDQFSYERWMEGLNRGNSFVTQGPLLDVRFNGELPGTTWTTSEQSTTVRVEGTIDSLYPLDAITLIRNGVSQRVTDYEAKLTEAGAWRTEIRVDVDVDGSGWVALRCDEIAPDGKVRFAHTNPVFIDNPTFPARPRRERVEFFIRRMSDEIARNEGVLTPEAVDEFRRAQAIYEKVASEAVD
jgi:hypothetical protein